jgi:hypothetical protein
VAERFSILRDLDPRDTVSPARVRRRIIARVEPRWDIPPDEEWEPGGASRVVDPG